MRLIRSVFTRVLFLFGVAFFSCTGGTDVSNPGKEIIGHVYDSNHNPVAGAMVIIGCDIPALDPLKSSDTVRQGGIVVILSRKLFDTTYTSVNGQFKYDSLLEGDYAISVKKAGMAGITYLSVYDNSNDLIKIELLKQVSVKVIPHTKPSFADVKFNTIRFPGTPFEARVDSSGIIKCDSLPRKINRLVLYRSDNAAVVYNNVNIGDSMDVEMIVDPLIDESKWVFKTDRHSNFQPPYVYQSGRWNNTVSIWDSSSYDIFIQFSHIMDPIVTLPAIKLLDQSNNVKISNFKWYSNDIVLIRLCSADTLGNCDPLLLSKSAPWNFSIDATAMSKYGIKMTWSESVTIK